MLRYTMLLLSLLLFTFLSHAQLIDSLQTDEQLLTFVGKVDNEVGTVFTVAPKPFQDTPYMINKIDAFGSLPFEKADFDNNGYTDLLFNGYCDDGNNTCSRISVVVLSFGADSVQVKHLTNHHGADCFAAKVIMMGSKPYIEGLRVDYIYKVRTNEIRYTEKKDTLDCILGDFVELAAPQNYAVEKIKVCFFSLGPFSIAISGDSAKLETARGLLNQDALDSGGLYTARIDPVTLKRIKGLLQYMRFPELQELYAVNWRSHVSGHTFITYNQGKVKEIKDDGLLGTYGLRALYEIFLDLRGQPIWKLVAPGPFYGILCNANN